MPNIMAGAAQPVQTSNQVPSAGPAVPVAIVSDGRPVMAGPYQPIVEVADNRPRTGGAAQPVVVGIGSGFPIIGPPMPVYVVSGSLNPAPVFRAASSAATSTVATSLQINVPAGVQNGDVMLFGIAIRGGTLITGLTLAGWGTVFTTNRSTTVQLGIFRRIAASEPASYTATWVTPGNAAGGIYAARNANATQPDISGSQGNASSTSCTAPSVVTTIANDLLIFAGGATGVIWTPPSTMIERVDVKSTDAAANAGFTFADETLSVAGATGTRVATMSGASESVGGLIAIKP